MLDDDAVFEHRDLGVAGARVRRFGADLVAHHHDPFDGLTAGQELGLGQDRRAAPAGVAAVAAALTLGLQPGGAADALDLVAAESSAVVAATCRCAARVRARRCWADRRAADRPRCRRRCRTCAAGAGGGGGWRPPPKLVSSSSSDSSPRPRRSSSDSSASPSSSVAGIARRRHRPAHRDRDRDHGGPGGAGGWPAGRPGLRRRRSSDPRRRRRRRRPRRRVLVASIGRDGCGATNSGMYCGRTRCCGRRAISRDSRLALTTATVGVGCGSGTASSGLATSHVANPHRVARGPRWNARCGSGRRVAVERVEHPLAGGAQHPRQRVDPQRSGRSSSLRPARSRWVSGVGGIVGHVFSSSPRARLDRRGHARASLCARVTSPGLVMVSLRAARYELARRLC